MAENLRCRLRATNLSPSDHRKDKSAGENQNDFAGLREVRREYISLAAYSGFAITPQAMRAGALAADVSVTA